MRHFSTLTIPILIISLLLSFCVQPLLSQRPLLASEAPETLEEATSVGGRILEGLKGAIKKVWQEEALPLWQKTWVKWWDSLIQPWLQNIWQKIQVFLGKEIEKRKPLIEEEFEKEKEELKEEIKKEMPAIWERFKELIR